MGVSLPSLTTTILSFSPSSLNTTWNLPSDSSAKYLFMVSSSSFVRFSSLNATIPVVLNAFLKIVIFLIFEFKEIISLFNSCCLTKNCRFCSCRASNLVLWILTCSLNSRAEFLSFSCSKRVFDSSFNSFSIWV